jgi:endoglucanase
MNSKRILVLSFLLIGLYSFNTGVKEAKTKHDEKFVIHRGLNVSHWLSQTEIRGEEREQYMQARDFKVIADMGYDHVRIPIDEEQMWDEAGNKNKEAFRLLHKAIKWSFENDLRVIVDLHILRSHHFNSDSKRLWTDTVAQQQFWGFWEQLSEELKQYPNDKLAYELLNEAVADNPEDWNNLIAKGIQTVRKNEPERTIVVGSNKWQMVYTFPELKVPENDTNLILSFHFYEPFIITHYRTSWNAMYPFEGNLNYPGYTIDTAEYANWDGKVLEMLQAQNGLYSKEVFQEKINIAIEVAKKYNLPLYCGEFGCFPSTPIALRQLVYADLISVFEENNIAWCHWNYKNDFPVVDSETLEPIEEIQAVLIKEQAKN